MAIEKYSGVASASVTKVDGVTLSNIFKVDGVNRLAYFQFTVDTSLGDGTPTYYLPFTSGTVSFTVFWGDGTSDTITSISDPAMDHTYSTGGVYSISLIGTLSPWGTGNGDALKVTGIESWGTNFTAGNFGNYTNLTTDSSSDTPVVAFANLFRNCSNFTGDVSHYNPISSSCTKMFEGCSSFNSDISGWDVSTVVSFGSMFSQCSSFNADISGWDVTNSTTHDFMFVGCTIFNQPIGNWTLVSGRTNSMLRSCVAFDQDLSNWSGVSFGVCNAMFQGASSFNNGGVNTGPNQGLDTWDLSSATNITRFFSGCSSFNCDLLNWDVSGVTDFSEMFFGCTVFDKPLDNWTIKPPKSRGTNSSIVTNSLVDSTANFVSDGVANNDFVRNTTDGTSARVTSVSATQLTLNADIFTGSSGDGYVVYTTAIQMDSMFEDCIAFDQNLNSWDVGAVSNFSRMFEDAVSFNGDISSWDLGSATNISRMFLDAESFSGDISGWNTSGITSLNDTFAQTANFNTDISSWDVSNVLTMRYSFTTANAFNQDLNAWDVSSCTDFQNCFQGCALLNKNFASWDLSSCNSLINAFNTQAISDANVAASLVGWEANVPNTGVNATAVFGGRTMSETTYPSAKTAFDNLIASTGSGGYGWVITGITWVA